MNRLARLRDAVRSAPLPVAGFKMNLTTWRHFLDEDMRGPDDAVKLHPYPQLFGVHVIFDQSVPNEVVTLNTRREEFGRLVLADPEVH